MKTSLTASLEFFLLIFIISYLIDIVGLYLSKNEKKSITETLFNFRNIISRLIGCFVGTIIYWLF